MLAWIRAHHPKSYMLDLLPTLVDTGLRIGEMVALKKVDVTFENGHGFLKVTKSKSRAGIREVPLTARAAECLRRAIERSKCEYVWTPRGGTAPLRRITPTEDFAKCRNALGITRGCVLHSTRHTFCSNLGNAGADAFTIQRLAGHASIIISQRYCHSTRESAVRAIGLLENSKQVAVGQERQQQSDWRR
jgi:integrase